MAMRHILRHVVFFDFFFKHTMGISKLTAPGP